MSFTDRSRRPTTAIALMVRREALRRHLPWPGLDISGGSKVRSIVWSTYVKPTSSTPDEMNHVASVVAHQLEKDKHPKEKAK